MNAQKILGRIKPGDVLTAELINQITAAVNANTKAIPTPKTVENYISETDPGAPSNIGNESFSAGPSDITSTTVTITDDNGDDHDIERIDEIVFTESTTGRTLTLSITYS